jgi:hypothetical protein
VHTEVIRPRVDGRWSSRLGLAVVAVAFAAMQLYLARLGSTRTAVVAVAIAVTLLAVLVGYLVFLLRARVIVSDDDVTVIDWLGRQTFRSERRSAHLRLISVTDMGIKDDFAIIWARQASGESIAVLLRRVAWGNEAISKLRIALNHREGGLHFRPVSKRDLSVEFPKLYTQNLPAVAAIVVMVLLIAILITRG